MTPGPARDEIHQELVRAEKSLNAAEILLRDNCLEDAVSRAYYAILHAARAALLAEGVKVTSHKGVRRLFSQHLIKTEKLQHRLAVILAEEQDDRFLADYDVTFAPEPERVQKRITDASEFLAAVKLFLQGHQIHL